MGIFRCRDSESSVDDLSTWRGVVLGRAVTTLRSVETQPFAWGFVMSALRSPSSCVCDYIRARATHHVLRRVCRRWSSRVVVLQLRARHDDAPYAAIRMRDSSSRRVVSHSCVFRVDVVALAYTQVIRARESACMHTLSCSRCWTCDEESVSLLGVLARLRRIVISCEFFSKSLFGARALPRLGSGFFFTSPRFELAHCPSETPCRNFSKSRTDRERYINQSLAIPEKITLPDTFAGQRAYYRFAAKFYKFLFRARALPGPYPANSHEYYPACTRVRQHFYKYIFRARALPLSPRRSSDFSFFRVRETP